jgi:hypothetical protein
MAVINHLLICFTILPVKNEKCSPLLFYLQGTRTNLGLHDFIFDTALRVLLLASMLDALKWKK